MEALAVIYDRERAIMMKWCMTNSK